MVTQGLQLINTTRGYCVIQLSDKTKGLLKKLQSNGLTFDVLKYDMDRIDLASLRQWFSERNNSKVSKDQKYLLALLKTSLLTDLLDTFNGKVLEKQEPAVSWYKKFQFGFLLLTGIFLAIFEGYKEAVYILGLIPFISPGVLIMSGVLFSVISIIAFFSCDLSEIAESLDIKFKHSKAIIDAYVEQIMLIDLSIKQIKINMRKNTNIFEIANQREMLYMLQEHYQDLIEEGEKFAAALNAKPYKAIKTTMSFLIGALFFVGGFLTGQALLTGIVIFLGLSLPAIWPIMLAGSAIGIVALFGYFLLESPGVERFLSKIFHLDVDSVNLLTDKDLQQDRANEIDDAIVDANKKMIDVENSYEISSGHTRPRSLSCESIFFTTTKPQSINFKEQDVIVQDESSISLEI